jgi:hypothetical protein
LPETTQSTTLVFMPPMYAAVKVVRGVQYATKSSSMARPGLFYDIRDLSPDAIRTFAAKRWLTNDMADSLVKLANPGAEDEVPAAVASSEPLAKALGFEGVRILEKPLRNIRFLKAQAMVNHRLAVFEARMETLPAKNLNSLKGHFNKIRNFVPKVSRYNVYTAEACVIFLGKVTSAIKKGLDDNVHQFLWRNFLMAVCCSRRKGVTLEAYKKATQKARENYFGKDANKMWAIYEENCSKGIVAHGKNLVASGFKAVKQMITFKPAAAPKAAIPDAWKPKPQRPISRWEKIKQLAVSFTPKYARLGKEKHAEAIGLFEKSYKHSTRFFGSIDPPNKWWKWFTTPAVVTHSSFANLWCGLLSWGYPEDLQPQNMTAIDFAKGTISLSILMIGLIPSIPYGLGLGLGNLLTGQWSGVASIDEDGLT